MGNSNAPNVWHSIKHLISPHFSDLFGNHPTNPANMWNGLTENIEIPTKFYFANQSLCDDLPITLVVVAYKGYGKIAPLRRNPQ